MSDQRLVLITGVSRGLGRHLAEEFAALDFRVAGCARSKAPVEELGKKLGGEHIFRSLDLTDYGAVEKFSEELLREAGVPDLLINSAAMINRPSPLWEYTAPEISSIVQVNLEAVIHVIRHFVPKMIDQGSGIVVNVSSGWGRSTSAGVAPYCATKWAIEGLTSALSNDLPAGLAAVSFNPGIIDTDMLRTCFGKAAGNYPGPAEWAKSAAPFLSKLSVKDNGKALSLAGY